MIKNYYENWIPNDFPTTTTSTQVRTVTGVVTLPQGGAGFNYQPQQQLECQHILVSTEGGSVNRRPINPAHAQVEAALVELNEFLCQQLAEASAPTDTGQVERYEYKSIVEIVNSALDKFRDKLIERKIPTHDETQALLRALVDDANWNIDNKWLGEQPIQQMAQQLLKFD